MTASLTPALALAYLAELSTDIRAAVVLDGAGAPLAGDARLAPRALELLATAAGPSPSPRGARIAEDRDGSLVAVARPDGVAIAVLAGPHALVSLLVHDLAAALDEMAAVAAPDA